MTIQTLNASTQSGSNAMSRLEKALANVQRELEHQHHAVMNFRSNLRTLDQTFSSLKQNCSTYQDNLAQIPIGALKEKVQRLEKICDNQNLSRRQGFKEEEVAA